MLLPFDILLGLDLDFAKTEIENRAMPIHFKMEVVVDYALSALDAIDLQCPGKPQCIDLDCREDGTLHIWVRITGVNRSATYAATQGFGYCVLAGRGWFNSFLRTDADNGLFYMGR